MKFFAWFPKYGVIEAECNKKELDKNLLSFSKKISDKIKHSKEKEQANASEV